MTQLIEESKSDLEYNVDHIIETLESGHYETEDENGPNGFDYLTDALDINYIINGDKTYKGARILVSFGGPNIWIDTFKEQVEGYWWGETIIKSYNQDNLYLDQACEEFYNC
tara:strand:+ start:454 stop:789 length:336 start_codon:yes stop_codon:yes gene_type:complete